MNRDLEAITILRTQELLLILPYWPNKNDSMAADLSLSHYLHRFEARSVRQKSCFQQADDRLEKSSYNGLLHKELQAEGLHHHIRTL